MSNFEVLSDKTLVMLVGPSAIGKSTLMDEIVKLHDDFVYVRTFTTRQRRSGEQSHYNFITRETAEQLQQDGRAITYVEHPTTHDIYGTTIESYLKRFNLLDTLSGSVADYRKLTFKQTITLAIGAPPDQWRAWFTSRYPTSSPEAEKRLSEAALSINWALEDPETHWLINKEGALRETAQNAIEIILHPPLERNIPDEPHGMLELITNGMWDVS